MEVLPVPWLFIKTIIVTMVSVLWVLWNVIIIFWPILLIILLPKLFAFCYYLYLYKKSDYKKESGIKFLKFYFDKGCFGEGLTFFKLEKLPVYSKIMTNLYIPTEDGTTEIDLLYICKRGVFVIESKNYSGWIFGNESSKNWTMVIYNYKKRFFNPIWQNKKHIEYLSKIINCELKSLIVFSERCSLKEINYDFNFLKVLKRNHLKEYMLNEIDKEGMLTNEQIDFIYNDLKKYTLKSEVEKQVHIGQIKENIQN